MTTLLENPLVFDLWNRFTGDISIKKKIISEYIHPFEGAKVLDMGCGTGKMAALINEVAPCSYVGFDLNPTYIEFAKKQNYPGTFYAADINKPPRFDTAFDIVLALDVMHHVNDEHARNLILFAKRILKRNGRFILLEPVITEKQLFFEKELMKLDRGKHIRKKETNLAFLRESFAEIKNELLSNSYLIPWTECIFRCK